MPSPDIDARSTYRRPKAINPIRHNLGRLRLFIARTSRIGVPVHRALLWELPRLTALRAYKRFAHLVYAFLDRRRLADRGTSRLLHQLTDDEDRYFYVIVVPRVLHLLIPAVRLVRDHVRVVFILNGVSPIEESVLRKEFPDCQSLRLWTLPHTSWPHGLLLSLLLRTSRGDFGIFDHDFFLFDHSALKQLTFRDNEFAICATGWRNSRTGIEFPGTHFLYLRAAPLRAIMERHGVGAQLYKRIPASAGPILEEMGLSLRNPPKEYQSFFDSFLLLSALAIHHGFEVRRMDIAAGDSVHIGGTSMGEQITKPPVHHYVSARFLELLSEKAVSKEYLRRDFIPPDGTRQMREALDPETAARVDGLIERLSSV